MSNLVVFDSSIIIDQIRGNRHFERLMRVEGSIRNSSVVLAELRRGAHTRIDRLTIEALERNHPTLVPSEQEWLESGRLLAQMRRDRGFEPHKLRDLHFDVLIALTARFHDARLITSNPTDFELIRQYRSFQLEVW